MYVFECPVVQTSFTSTNLKEILSWVKFYVLYEMHCLPKVCKVLTSRKIFLYDDQIR